MSKPLTIEQLKALKNGDWVWIIVLEDDSYNNKADKGSYRPIRKAPPGRADEELWCGGKLNEVLYLTMYSYVDYGNKWIAYKNKEEAGENMSINAPCKLGDILYFVSNPNQPKPHPFRVESLEAKMYNGEWVFYAFDRFGYGGLCGDLKESGWYVGNDKDIAEARLKELQEKQQ